MGSATPTIGVAVAASARRCVRPIRPAPTNPRRKGSEATVVEEASVRALVDDGLIEPLGRLGEDVLLHDHPAPEPLGTQCTEDTGQVDVPF